MADAQTLREIAAKAIEGPFIDVPPGCKYSLADLRDVRWGRLSEQEKRHRLLQADAVIRALATSQEHSRDK